MSFQGSVESWAQSVKRSQYLVRVMEEMIAGESVYSTRGRGEWCPALPGHTGPQAACPESLCFIVADQCGYPGDWVLGAHTFPLPLPTAPCPLSLWEKSSTGLQTTASIDF